MIGGLPRNSFVFVEFEEGGGVLEVATFAFGAVRLDFAEVVHSLLELAREPLVVQAESGEGAVGVDDVEVDPPLIGGWVGGAIEEGGFERGDAVEAPGGVGEFLGELGLGGGCGLVFVEEAAAMGVERCFPESVRGPVECLELARLIAARSTGVGWRDVIVVVDIWGTSEPG